MRRLIWRKTKEHPLGMLKLLWKTIRLERQARKRLNR